MTGGVHDGDTSSPASPSSSAVMAPQTKLPVARKVFPSQPMGMMQERGGEKPHQTLGSSGLEISPILDPESSALKSSTP